jgi:hypothetical protein
MWSGFDEVPVECCNREGNVVAHELAKHAFTSNSSCNWFEESPSFIFLALANDVTLLSNQ